MCLHTCSKCEVLVFESVRDISTYLQEEGIRVEFTVKTATRADADQLKGTMTADTINRELTKSGLPNAEIVQAPTVEQIDSSTSGSPYAEVDYDKSVCLIYRTSLQNKKRHF